MKCKLADQHACYVLLFFTFFHLLFTQISSKTFMDLAQDEIFTKENYKSDKYAKEAASLNPEYYTSKGEEELEKCREVFSANYDRCSRFKTCNMCGANPDCGWCNEKKLCVPVELNARNDQIIPQCQGDCIRILKIEYCYKALFEPENTQDEVNFANYPEVLQEDSDSDSDSDNIFEKALEKNFYEMRNQKKSSNSSSNLINFKQLDPQKDPNCDDSSDNLNINITPTPNHTSLDYIPNASTNKPLAVDLDSHHERLIKDLTDVSKQVFSDLVEKHVDKSADQVSLLQPNFQTEEEKREEMMKNLKEFIPNFEFPQFVNSDLEDSIDKIKKEKLLLWLRGYSLNEPDAKKHLPIYKNLTFTDEDQVRKSFLDKFYKDLVIDPYKNVNSGVYKNLMGQETLFGDKIQDKMNERKAKNGYVIPVIESKGGKQVKIIKKPIAVQPIPDAKILTPSIIGKGPKEIVKSLKIINSNYVDKKDLLSLVKRDNMRFKEDEEKEGKSLQDISNELKSYLKNLR